MKFVIFGDTPFAERLYGLIKAERQAEVIAFTQQKEYITRTEIDGKIVVPFEECGAVGDEFSILLGIGYSRMNSLREKIYNLCKKAGYSIGTYISKDAHVYTDAIGEGTVIWSCAYIGENCTVGNGNFFMASSLLAHDNIVGNFNYIAPRAVLAGHTNITDNCFVGANATVINKIELKKQTLVGAGSVMIKMSDYTYNGGGGGGAFVGNPARLLPGKKAMETKI